MEFNDDIELDRNSSFYDAIMDSNSNLDSNLESNVDEIAKYDLNMNNLLADLKEKMNNFSNCEASKRKRSLNYEMNNETSILESNKRLTNNEMNKRSTDNPINKKSKILKMNKPTSNYEINHTTSKKFPSKIFSEIVLNLPIKDKLNFRAVCKDWKNAIDSNLKIENIIFANKYNLKINNKISNFLNILSDNQLNNQNFYKIAMKQPIFDSVKEIIINEFTLLNTIKILSIFDQIIKLKIDQIDIDMSNNQHLDVITFNLRELTDFEFIYSYNIPILIKCPKLNNIKFGFTENVHLEFQFPQSIELAEFDIYNNCVVNFKNLKQLNCLDFVGLASDLLKILTKLNEIYTVQYEYFHQFKSQQFKFDRISDVNVYYFGVNLQSYRDHNAEIELPFDEESIFKINAEQLKFMINKQLAPKLPNFESISYQASEPVFHNLPDSFFKKLTSLKELNILEEIEDNQLNDFIRFISKCSYNNFELNNLVLRLHFLSYTLLAIVSRICPFITNMQICDYIYRDDEALDYRPFQPADFEFIFFFTKLTELSISKQINCHFIKRLFDELKDLVVLNFVLNRGDPFSITNCNNEGWVLTFRVSRKEENKFFDSLVKLIEFIKTL